MGGGEVGAKVHRLLMSSTCIYTHASGIWQIFANIRIVGILYRVGGNLTPQRCATVNRKWKCPLKEDNNV